MLIKAAGAAQKALAYTSAAHIMCNIPNSSEGSHLVSNPASGQAAHPCSTRSNCAPSACLYTHSVSYLCCRSCSWPLLLLLLLAWLPSLACQVLLLHPGRLVLGPWAPDCQVASQIAPHLVCHLLLLLLLRLQSHQQQRSRHPHPHQLPRHLQPTPSLG